MKIVSPVDQAFFMNSSLSSCKESEIPSSPAGASLELADLEAVDVPSQYRI